jgi:hypothetical protein
MTAEHPALAGLHDVAWERVSHACGPATDVPELLEELAGTREQQEHALYELYGNIWHQGHCLRGDGACGSVPRAPGAQRAGAAARRAVALLTHIANGSSYLDVHQDMVPGGLTEDERSAMKEELANVEAARAEVLESLPQLVEKVMAEPTPGGQR